MSKLSPQAQALLDAGRDALSPTAATKEGVLRSIDANLAAGTAITSSGVMSASKLWLALALAAGVGGGWLLFRHNTNDPKPSVALASELEVTSLVSVVAEPTTPFDPPDNPPVEIDPPSLEVAIETAQPTAPSVPRKANPKPAKSPANSLLAERKLIASAQRAIRSKNYSEAKALLRSHEKRHPNGILGPERQAAQAIVNCLEPTGTNGKAIARRFLQDYSMSPLAPRVRSICKLRK